MLLKGPTGCGKTRFVEYMAWRLGRPLTIVKDKGGDRTKGAKSATFQALPLITVACHEDLTASDLVGRYLLEGESTRWIDGPLTRAVKVGAIAYLDEVVEARKDTTVLIHPLTDHRRILPIEKRGQILEAREGFLLVISYNPGYQSALKDLKHSTRQRFISLEFTHPRKELEAKIIAHESGVSDDIAQDLAKLGEKVRNLREHGLSEGVSTRLLVYTGKMIHAGIPRTPRLPGRRRLGADRRRRRAAQHRGSGQQHLRVGAIRLLTIVSIRCMHRDTGCGAGTLRTALLSCLRRPTRPCDD